MVNNIFEEIDSLHSQWSMGNKVGRLAFLKGQWNRLNYLAGQLALYFQRKGGLTPEEGMSAEHLIKMMQYVESEGRQLQRELSNDVYTELVKLIVKQ